MAQQESGTNWIVVGAGALFLALAVLAFNDPLLRALAAVVVFVAAFVMARPRDDSTIENPLLEKLRTHKDGLDRRKYGRLRSTTERLLDNVRQMNKIAIDGREGRLSPRHAHAELDRLAAVMRDVIDEIRKAAGVPTPAPPSPLSFSRKPRAKPKKPKRPPRRKSSRTKKTRMTTPTRCSTSWRPRRKRMRR
jgi:hypothetical protein